MKLNKKLLSNFKTNISFIGVIFESICKINIKTIPKKIFTIKTNISPKNFKLLEHVSKLCGPAKLLYTFKSNIEVKKVKLLFNCNTMLNFKFFINKENYKEYSPVIYDNIDELYIRISGLYKTVSNKFVNEFGMEYVKDSYELTEQIFNYILSDLQEYKTYSEITDRIILKEIVMYFRGL